MSVDNNYEASEIISGGFNHSNADGSGINESKKSDGYNVDSISVSGKASYNAHYFESKADLIAALDGIVKNGDTLLVKASHSMQFDEIVDYLSNQASVF